MGLVPYNFEPEYSVEQIQSPIPTKTQTEDRHPFSEQQQPIQNILYFSSFLKLQMYMREKCYGSRIFPYLWLYWNLCG